jgi:hypothetical protein
MRSRWCFASDMDVEQGRDVVWERRGGGVVRGKGNKGRGGEAMTGHCFREAEATQGDLALWHSRLIGLKRTVLGSRRE